MAVIVAACGLSSDAYARGRRGNSGQMKQIQQMQQMQLKAYQQAIAAQQEAARKAAAHKLELRKASAEAARKAHEHDREVAKAWSSEASSKSHKSETRPEGKRDARSASSTTGTASSK